MRERGREGERGGEGKRQRERLKKRQPELDPGEAARNILLYLFFVILSQANRSKAAQREKAG